MPTWEDMHAMSFRWKSRTKAYACHSWFYVWLINARSWLSHPDIAWNTSNCEPSHHKSKNKTSLWLLYSGDQMQSKYKVRVNQLHTAWNNMTDKALRAAKVPGCLEKVHDKHSAADKIPFCSVNNTVIWFRWPVNMRYCCRRLVLWQGWCCRAHKPFCTVVYKRICRCKGLAPLAEQA